MWNKVRIGIYGAVIVVTVIELFITPWSLLPTAAFFYIIDTLSRWYEASN